MIITTVVLSIIFSGFYFLYNTYKVSAKKISATQFSNVVIGHRGYKALYPENTLSGITQAYLAGANGVEFDIRLSKDNIPILIHDSSLKRTTNGSGRISKFNYNEIKKFNNKHGEKISSEKIPTLEQALELVKKYNLKANIELKHTRKADELVNIVIKAIRNNNLYQQVYVSSFLPNYLYKIRKSDPNVITALNIGEISRNKLINYLYNKLLAPYIADFINVSIIGPDYKLLNSKTINYYQAKEFILIPYTVNNSQDKQLFKDKKISYITDDLSSKD